MINRQVHSGKFLPQSHRLMTLSCLPLLGLLLALAFCISACTHAEPVAEA
jgi:hypothetical protein